MFNVIAFEKLTEYVLVDWPFDYKLQVSDSYFMKRLKGYIWKDFFSLLIKV